MRALTRLIGALILVTLVGCSSVGKHHQNIPAWQLVYSHDAHGSGIAGSKNELLNAVRAGQSVRVYWAGRRVEHVADAFFLTILGDEVFAQIETIQGQAPAVNPPTIEFREGQWRTILSTNGKQALRWYAFQ